jgi:5'-deoxynucleotidase YfbR-like HD superfamily hydrolase
MEKTLNSAQIFDAIIELHKNYCLIHRRNVSYDKYKVLEDQGLIESPQVTVEQPLITESLLEHVGNLPVVATFLYPYLEQKENINLGRVLTMLAIHDIGETKVGDAHPHRKTQEEVEAEHTAALSLLSEGYHDLFNEYEECESLDAKFAKAVDVFSTFLSDQLHPREVVQARLKAHSFSWHGFEEKRTEVFEWDAFLKELFQEVIKRYKVIESPQA